MAPMVADRRVCLDRSLSRLVEESDMDAAFLLAATGQEIPPDAVKRLGLEVWADGRVMQGPEPEPMPEPVMTPEPEPVVVPLADLVQPAGAMPDPKKSKGKKKD